MKWSQLLLPAMLVYSLLFHFKVFIAMLLLMIPFVYFLYKNQSSMLYQPSVAQCGKPADNPQGFRNPAEFDVPFVHIDLETPDKEQVSSWLMLQEESRQCSTIMFFQGNAGNIGMRLHNLVLMYKCLGCNVLAISYRGYGDSTGIPSEDSLSLDAEIWLDHLKQRDDIDPERIVLFGRSLGGAVAISLAGTRSDEIRATILENTFSSVSDLVNTLFPFLIPFKKYLLKLKWRSDERIGSIAHPMLFLVGASDELIPNSHMQLLYKKADAVKEKRLEVFEGRGHNDVWMDPKYMNVISEFLAEVIG